MVSAAKQLPDDPSELKFLLLNERSARLKERSASVQREDELKQQIHSLLEALRLEKHRLYGASSEKSPDQSELFDEADFYVDEADVAEEQAADVPATPSKPKPQPTRKPLPAELPRVRHVIELSDEERQCPCGCTLVEIGEDISEQVDIIPARVQVIQHVLRNTPARAVKTPSKQPRGLRCCCLNLWQHDGLCHHLQICRWLTPVPFKRDSGSLRD
jgi:transposase